MPNGVIDVVLSKFARKFVSNPNLEIRIQCVARASLTAVAGPIES